MGLDIFFREVSNEHVCACSKWSNQSLIQCVRVQVTFSDCVGYHGKFTTDHVGCNRQICCTSSFCYKVKVEQGRLYHHSVSTLLDVKLDLSHRLPAVPVVHLIASPVSE